MEKIIIDNRIGNIYEAVQYVADVLKTELIAENKDVIIDRAANMVADSASLKKALDMISVELNMKEEATK